MSRKKTTEEFKKEIFDLSNGDEYELLSEYINSTTDVIIRHNKCNNEIKIKPNNFLRTPKCWKCYGKKRTTEQFKNDVKEVHGNSYTVLEDYVSNKTNILVMHNECNTTYKVRPQALLKGARCHECYGTKKKTQNDFENEIFKLFGDEYSILSQYTGSNKKVSVRHNLCGHIYEVRASHIANKTKCPKCNRAPKSTDEFKEDVFNIVGNTYEVLGEYCKSDIKIKIKHNECGNVDYITPNAFLNGGRRCIYCAKTKGYSNAEKELLDYITSILPIETEIISNDRTVLKPKELDIYIPNLNIAFEYNGLYWHTEEYIDKNYHLDKMIECNKKGIKLIHIFEDEWLNNQELMKNKIANLLGVNNNNKVYARKCYVKEIEDNQIKNNFLNENHIQGKDNSKFSYGLYTKENNNLVAILTLCKPRVNMGMKSKEDGLYELSRYATNCNVIGGMGKILKYIKLNNQDVNKIYTYADLRFTDKEDNVYLKNGFKFVSQSRPNYWYFVSGERKCRFNYQKGNLKKLFSDVYDDSLSEKEIMEIMGYYRIYDCGNLKYEIDMK